MTALLAPQLPPQVTEEMARLKCAGLHLLPLGGGNDGKSPLLRKWAGPKPSLGNVLGPMFRTGLPVYGIRLDGLAVIDCDTDDAELVTRLENRFGPSPVHVKTPRGRHLYYRSDGDVPNLRAEGLPVDVKTGPRSYVVGPLSVRPDGGEYVPAKGVLGVDVLPRLRGAAATRSAPIQRGNRHVQLVKGAISMVEYVDDPDELQANLAGLRDDWCEDPATMPDRELRDIALWAWTCRLENRVYHGRNSVFQVQRAALDALRGLNNDADAIALYVLLVDKHGHRPGYRFGLDFEAMREAGLTSLSVRRLREARRTLEEAGLLALASKHRAGVAPRTYALTRPGQCVRPDSSPSVVTGLAAAAVAPEEKGGGLRLHMTSDFAPNRRSASNCC